jgi:glucosamine--fructose-6-phosphate aminotransferase (isomerizing)
MCGIIAVVRRPGRRPPPEREWIDDELRTAWTALSGDPIAPVSAIDVAAAQVAAVDAALRGSRGVRRLIESPDLVVDLEARMAAFDTEIGRLERWADSGDSRLSGAELEAFNAALISLKDAVWAVRKDRLRTAAAVAELAGPDAAPAAIEAYTSVQLALSGLDRLEVRGRDSAGIHLLVEGHGLDLDSAAVQRLLAGRTDDPLFTSLAVRAPGGLLGFVYKAAAEIGELGDNVRTLRTAIAGDALLRLALQADTAQCGVLGHTRWASVGIISQANAHPLNQEEQDGGERPYVTAALNGDVDNHADLREQEQLAVPAAITTDAKVIPAIVARRLAEGLEPADAFRQTVARFEGSVAIAATTAAAPGQLLLALRGSGQALYVGLAEDAFIVASEPYGLVEETPHFLRMDGEAKGPGGMEGQVVVLDRDEAGTVEGIRRFTYDGAELPVTPGELTAATITTRDIDRGSYPHFLLKEITEAPVSFRKTLRGKIDDGPDGARAALGHDSVPAAVLDRVREGKVRRIIVTGQGTAAVAGLAVASFLEQMLAASAVVVSSTPATELSGFGLQDDMSDTVVVAISQSGTTTDTNRTVDLVRARDATVLSIVNRRNSDLVEKSDGVIYTSDGRDVEMAVPSTKAFYAQVAAGVLLAAAIGEAAGADRRAIAQLLEGLRAVPDAMEAVLATRPDIAEAAHRWAPARRYWAVVGNGSNRVAAEEIRIKLSELCYKSIACDATEDKKHIDLSAEPLIIVCAAGLRGPNADDVAKEIAIYRAHKATPVVIATQGGTAFPSAVATLTVPPVHTDLAFVLSAMVGHLFGYEAALAIDGQARPLREARALIEAAVSGGHDSHVVLEELRTPLEPLAARFLDDLRTGSYDGTLEASTAVRLASVLRYATGLIPLDAYQLDFGRVGTPAVVAQDVTDALTRAIEELTRPIDAIKHQAKTVTVGISRSEDELIRVPLTEATLAAGAPRDRLSYRVLRGLAALDPAVEEITGYTRYRIEASDGLRDATIHVVDGGGDMAGVASRTADDPSLTGIKHRVAFEQETTAARGRRDGRTLVLVPETKDKQTTGLTLLHVRFADRLAPADARHVLEGYRGRYGALRDAVTETEPGFRDEVLGDLPVIDLLDQPVHVLAEHWRTQ